MLRVSLYIRLTALIVLSAYLWVLNKYVKPFDSSDQLFMFEIALTQLLTILFIALIPGALLALILLSNRPYKKRILDAYAVSLMICCLVFGYCFCSAGPRYAAVPVIQHIGCKTMHIGKFKTNDVTISRDSIEQVETNIKTGEVFHAYISWLSDCEYMVRDGENTAKVKILSVDAAGYECIVSSGSRTSERIRVEKTSD